MKTIKNVCGIPVLVTVSDNGNILSRREVAPKKPTIRKRYVVYAKDLKGRFGL